MSENQLATKPRDLNDLIQSSGFRSQVALALPKFLEPERMLRIAVTQIRKSEKLQQCTQDSLLAAIMTASQAGIEVDGRNGHLVPRWNGKLRCYEAQFQADYKGLVGLVRRNDKVIDIYADIVRENDEFEIIKGLRRDLTHKIDIKKPRGSIVGAYAVIIYEKTTSFDFMDLSEIHEIRSRSDSWQAFEAKKISTCTWVTDEGEMCKKTVLKRLMKLADLSGDTSERMRAEDEQRFADIPIARATVKDPVLPAPNRKLLSAPTDDAPEPGMEDTSDDVPKQEEQPAATVTQEPVERPKETTAAPRTRKPTTQKTVDVPSEVKTEAQPDPASVGTTAPAGGTSASSPAVSKADRLRNECKGYDEDEILRVMIEFNLCEPSVKSIDGISEKNLDFALTDVKALLEELKFKAQSPV